MSHAVGPRCRAARSRFLVPLVAVLGAGCGDGTDPPQLETIALTSPIGDVVAASTTFQLTAEATDTRGNPMSGLALEWSSSAPAAASVSSTGLVTTHAAGTPRIEARWGDISAEIELTVLEVDRAAIEGWLGDPWTAALVDGLGVADDIAAALAALEAGDLNAVDEALAAVETAAAAATDPDARPRLAVLALITAHARASLGL